MICVSHQSGCLVPVQKTTAGARVRWTASAAAWMKWANSHVHQKRSVSLIITPWSPKNWWSPSTRLRRCLKKPTPGHKRGKKTLRFDSSLYYKEKSTFASVWGVEKRRCEVKRMEKLRNQADKVHLERCERHVIFSDWIYNPEKDFFIIRISLIAQYFLLFVLVRWRHALWILEVVCCSFGICFLFSSIWFLHFCGYLWLSAL